MARRVRGGRIFLAAASIASTLFLAGCGPTKQEREAHHGVNAFFVGDFRRAAAALEPIAKKPDENFVLNNCRLGSAELANYDYTGAQDAFLRAYEVINSVGVNDGGRGLGAAVVSEKIKVWKGEPFERAMANFYLGLLYYIQNDYGNARGAFENSLFKLRDYADKRDEKRGYREQESNFAVALIMLGKSWQKLGRDDLAEANFERARELRPDLAGLCDAQQNASANVLLVVEYGNGPRKVRDVDGSFVGFQPTPGEVGPIPWPLVSVDGRGVDLRGVAVPTVDLLAMAQDRRWQDIDTIRAIKDVLGTGLIVGGAGTSIYGVDRRDQGAAIAGLALMGAGALIKASSISDIRQWEMLPRTVFLLPLHVPPGKHDVSVNMPGQRWLSQSWEGMVAPASGEATYYIRLLPYTQGVHIWPPPALAGLSPD